MKKKRSQLSPKKIHNSSSHKKEFEFDSSQYIKLPPLNRRNSKTGRLINISEEKK